MENKVFAVMVGVALLLVPVAGRAQSWSDHHYPGSECFLNATPAGGYGGSGRILKYPNYIESSGTTYSARVSCPAIYDIGGAYGSYSTTTIQWVQVDYHDNNNSVGSD